MWTPGSFSWMMFPFPSDLEHLFPFHPILQFHLAKSFPFFIVFISFEGLLVDFWRLQHSQHRSHKTLN